MGRYTGKFISLVESMKSDNDSYGSLMEEEKEKKERTGTFRDRERTASGKRKTRDERQSLRREEAFATGQEMALKPFLRALESLKSQIIAENSGVYNAVNNKGEGAKYGIPIMRGLEATLKNVMDLIASVTTKMSREGNYLDMGKNPEDIESYRTLYTKAQTDYAKYAQEWVESTRKDRLERPVDNKNKEIEASLNSAITFFNKAKDLFIKNSSSFVKSSTSSSSSTASGTGSAVTLTSTIKQRKAVYTGTEGETVKSVKLMIYQKFKKYTKLASHPDWKIVFKKPSSPSSTLRENTASVIKMVKAGLAKSYPDLASDKTGDITPAFVKVLSELKEGLENRGNKLISFSDFMNKKINEQFDEDAAIAASSSSSSSSGGGAKKKKASPSSSSSSSSGGGKSSVPSYSSTPFKTQEEGNKFRAWVIKTHPDWAKSNSLDATGPKDNAYIRKAYSEYSTEYAKESSTVKKSAEAKWTNKELDQLEKHIKSLGGKTKLQFTSDTKESCLMFYWGKAYGWIFLNRRVKYISSGGKTFLGTYAKTGETPKVKFDNGKTLNLKQIVTSDVSEMLSMTKEESEKATKAEQLLVKMSEMIVSKFGETSFWKPFKGTFNDDEDAAVLALTKWYAKTIEDAYYKPAINRINQLPLGTKAKVNLMLNKTKEGFDFDKLIRKLYGSTADDTYSWKVYKSDGTSKSYSVDTDF
jgi:hypothetical protein